MRQLGSTALSDGLVPVCSATTTPADEDRSAHAFLIFYLFACGSPLVESRTSVWRTINSPAL